MAQGAALQTGCPANERNLQRMCGSCAGRRDGVEQPRRGPGQRMRLACWAAGRLRVGAAGRPITQQAYCPAGRPEPRGGNSSLWQRLTELHPAVPATARPQLKAAHVPRSHARSTHMPGEPWPALRTRRAASGVPQPLPEVQVRQEPRRRASALPRPKCLLGGGWRQAALLACTSLPPAPPLTPLSHALPFSCSGVGRGSGVSLMGCSWSSAKRTLDGARGRPPFSCCEVAAMALQWVWR